MKSTTSPQLLAFTSGRIPVLHPTVPTSRGMYETRSRNCPAILRNAEHADQNCSLHCPSLGAFHHSGASLEPTRVPLGSAGGMAKRRDVARGCLPERMTACGLWAANPARLRHARDTA